jgi:hypothetical protein
LRPAACSRDATVILSAGEPPPAASACACATVEASSSRPAAIRISARCSEESAPVNALPVGASRMANGSPCLLACATQARSTGTIKSKLPSLPSTSTAALAAFQSLVLIARERNSSCPSAGSAPALSSAAAAFIASGISPAISAWR